MSTSSFDPVSFLMKISPPMLVEYAKEHDIALELEGECEDWERYANQALALIEKESEAKQGSFWMDIDDIDSMSTQEACEYLTNKLHEKGIPLDEETVDGFKRLNQRAMYFYLHHKDLFYETFDSYSLDTKQGWKGRKTVTLSLDQFIQNVEDFKKALKQLYKKEYKGKKVKIRYTDKGDRVIFTAHIEDVYTTDTEFEKESENLNNKKPRKPVFPLNFLYRYEDGVLEVKAQGGQARVKQLQNLFIEHFLKGDPSEFAKVLRFSFDKVQDLAALTFPVSVEDGIESVTLTGLKIVGKETGSTIALDIIPKDGKTGVVQILEELGSMNIRLEEFEIKKFKVQVIFKPVGRGRKRQVTAEITYPDGCTLKQREIDVMVYKLLKKWGLVLF